MKKSILINNSRLTGPFQPDRLYSLVIENKKIKKIGPAVKTGKGVHCLDAGGRLVAPGFIDLHMQGAGGSDVLDATDEAMRVLSRASARFGVTAFLATTIFKPAQKNSHLEIASKNCNRDLGGARMLGIHLEGPFISSEKRGMITPDAVCRPSGKTYNRILQLSGGHLKMMTIAPEIPGSLKIIREMTRSGIIASFGHSSASLEETIKGFKTGIRHVTHFYNAMPSMHHRDPGPIPAVLNDNNISVQIIPDGVHLHPEIVKLTYQVKGEDNLITITDGMQALGLPDGIYQYNNMEYESKKGAARYSDGTLIGTTLGLNQLVKRLMKFTGCPLASALKSVTINPARLLGIEKKKGSIREGYDADLVILEKDLSIRATMAGGEIVHRKNPAATGQAV